MPIEINEDLIKQWEPKIHRMLATTSVRGYSREDLEQELRISILKAAKGFNEDKGVIFHTYLHTAMVNTLRTLIAKAQRQVVTQSIDVSDDETGLQSQKILQALEAPDDSINNILLSSLVESYKLTDSELNQAFKAFKDLADRKREITNADLESLMSSQRRTSDVPNLYTLSSVKVTSGNDSTPTATVTIDNPEGSSIIESSVGTGPVDAVYKAIDKVVQVDNELLEYRVEAVTEGIDAIGDVSIRISKDNTIYVGRGSDTDIIVASAKAYMNAINRVLAFN